MDKIKVNLNKISCPESFYIPEMNPVFVWYTNSNQRNFEFGILVGKYHRLYLFKAPEWVLLHCTNKWVDEQRDDLKLKDVPPLFT